MSEMSERLGRAQALTTLQEWTKGESLRKHGMAVSVCTEAYGVLEAERLGLSGADAEELVELYASAGLLHDMDYERHPTQEEHPFVGVKHLREQGWPESVLRAILAHADYSGVARESHLDRTLFTCDELAGFLTACALVKPEDITGGAELLGLSVEEHVGNCLRAMQARAGELGLAGQVSVA